MSMRLMKRFFLGVFVAVSPGFVLTQAALLPSEVHQAEMKKTQVYIHDGIVIGGDRAINDVTVRDIRRATQTGFERIVIDLEASRGDQPTAIPRAPFYQVSIEPDQRRVLVTIWGNPRLGVTPMKILEGFKKSAMVAKVEILPKVEEENWTFALYLRAPTSVEVFELSSPVRVILDVKTQGSAVSNIGQVFRGKKKTESKPAVYQEPKPSTPRFNAMDNGEEPPPTAGALDSTPEN